MSYQPIKIHENDIIALRNDSELTSNHIVTLNDNDIQILTAISMTSKIFERVINSLLNIAKVDDILAQSDSAKLSRFSISEVKLSQLIDQVYLARKDRQGAPIFSGKSCKYYYSLPLAHSWAIEDSQEVITLLQVITLQCSISEQESLS